ncbi:MAG: PilZ domain-containing protein [Candidatus Omnitrophica bacterium]|nr:PilZ domain-containing protein [Candidatus Omnitrophota bacterium]MCM8783780.1 PilZ domain-containing protein [Candidatus Omnitrophota bacterium]
MDENLSLQNRRRYHRINFDTSVTYQTKVGSRLNHTLTRDLSEGGMGVIFEEFLPKDAELILEFSLKKNSTPIRTRAKVVWVQKLPYTERYRAGLEFEEMEALQKSNLKRFINKEPLLFYY